MSNIRKGSHAYYDDKHFPMGFNRSGDFTIGEAKLLTEYGSTLKQLSDGKLSAESSEEDHFLDVVSGSTEAQTEIEKLWLKYIKVTAPQVFISIYGSAKPKVEDDEPEDDLLL